MERQRPTGRWLHFLAAAACGPWFAAAGAGGRRLRRLIVFARHSVKNPYPPPDAPIEPGVVGAPLTAYTGRPLPQFKVSPGQLTQQGRVLMRNLGAYYRERYAELFQGLPCHRAVLFADPDSQRDVDSAEAFAEGLLAPGGCTAAVNLGNLSHRLRRIFRDAPDDWDHRHGCTPPSTEELRALLGLDRGEAEGNGGGAAASWLRVYRRQLSVVQDQTQCCSQDVCGPAAGGNLCTVFSIPLVLAPNISWRAVGGPLGVASAFAEIFEMQLCEGLEAGWGLREEDVVELLSLLEVPFHDAGTNAVTAQHLGSDLMDELLATLAPSRPEDAPVVSVYYGHDTNLQFLRRMFRLKWLSEGWWPNVVEPGAQLAFEVYDEGDGQPQTVRLLKVAATPKQQRLASSLVSGAPPPSVEFLWVPGCDGVFCPLPQLLEVGRAAMRRECVEAPVSNGTWSPDLSPRPSVVAAATAVSDIGVPVLETPASSAPDASKADDPGIGAVVAEASVKKAEDVEVASASSFRATDAGASGKAMTQGTAPVVTAPPLKTSQEGGFGTSFMFLIVIAAVGFLGWRYAQKKRAASGYETLSSSRRQFSAGDRFIGRGSGGGPPGFTL